MTKILENLGEEKEKREQTKRIQAITEIADNYVSDLLEEEVTVGELGKMMQYITGRVNEKTRTYLDNTFVSQLKS